MQSKNIQPFILKAGDSINDHPNENGPNSKLKALYNILKAKKDAEVWYHEVSTSPHELCPG